MQISSPSDSTLTLQHSKAMKELQAEHKKDFVVIFEEKEVACRMVDALKAEQDPLRCDLRDARSTIAKLETELGKWQLGTVTSVSLRERFERGNLVGSGRQNVIFARQADSHRPTRRGHS